MLTHQEFSIKYTELVWIYYSMSLKCRLSVFNSEENNQQLINAVMRELNKDYINNYKRELLYTYF